MKNILTIVIAFLVIIAILVMAYKVYTKEHPEVAATSTQPLRDSIKAKRDTVEKITTVYITKIKHITADTLGPILQALAARDVVYKGDTLKTEPDIDSCDIQLSCSEARRLLWRDTVKTTVQDSTSDDVKIQEARADSISARLETCLNKKPFIGYIAAFEAGYVAGTVVTAGVCLLIK